MNWSTIKARIANLWGKTTTLLLGAGLAIQSVLVDPGAQAFVASIPWAPKAIGVLGLAIVILRTFAPPPPSVPITEGARATKLDDNTIVIEAEKPLPAAVVEAAAAKDDVIAIPISGSVGNEFPNGYPS